MSSPKSNAVILVSGGLDSATVLAIARQQNFECHALSFNYGQRHHFELEASKKVCASLGVHDHAILPLDLRRFGGSALTSDLDVPKHRDESEMTDIPATYVPARNTVFLSIALAWAETIPAFDIFIGVNAIDYSGYPDCRPEFISQFEKLANLATKAGVEGQGQFRIHTPLINMTKAEIIRTGIRLGVDYSLTHSCYDPLPNGQPCGCCDSCVLRQKGFAEIGMDDPLRNAFLAG